MTRPGVLPVAVPLAVGVVVAVGVGGVFFVLGGVVRPVVRGPGLSATLPVEVGVGSEGSTGKGGSSVAVVVGVVGGVATVSDGVGTGGVGTGSAVTGGCTTSTVGLAAAARAPSTL